MSEKPQSPKQEPTRSWYRLNMVTKKTETGPISYLEELRVRAVEHTIGEDIMDRIIASTETADMMSYSYKARDGKTSDMVFVRKDLLDDYIRNTPGVRLQ